MRDTVPVNPRLSMMARLVADGHSISTEMRILEGIASGMVQKEQLRGYGLAAAHGNHHADPSASDMPVLTASASAEGLQWR